MRELRNVVERALVLCLGGPIGPAHLPLDAPPVEARAESALPRRSVPAARGEELRSLKEDVGELERQRIVEALEQCAGNQTKAARLLGISRRTLLARLDAWGLPRPRK